MGKNRYVGHRYIPIFENVWDKTRTYEPLTFVYYEGKTYVSRQLVPKNVEITDNDFWAFFMDNAPQIFTPTFTGQWEDKTYEPLSIVIDNGNTYVSKQNVPVGTLLTDTTYWLDLSTYYNQLFTDYEAAEQERQSAELIRIDNEEQRKIDHDNRSGELDIKADKVVVENFMNVDTRFSNLGVTHSKNKGVIDLTINDDSTSFVGVYNSLPYTVEGHLYFVSADYMVSKDAEASMGSYSDRKTLNITKHDAWETITVTTLRTTTTSFVWYVKLTNAKVGDVFKLRNLTVIDLTETFGAGNEPTKEEMGELIKVTGYIDGEYALNNKEMLMWTLSLIRGNKNAIISLGGTI